jgi:hypothetical protein
MAGCQGICVSDWDQCQAVFRIDMAFYSKHFNAFRAVFSGFYAIFMFIIMNKIHYLILRHNLI